MTKKVCPKCKSSDELAIEKRIDFELRYNEYNREFEIGPKIDTYSRPNPEDDDTVTCGCGWEGNFHQLINPLIRHRIVLIAETAEEHTSWNTFDWFGAMSLDEDSGETVKVDAVERLS